MLKIALVNLPSSFLVDDRVFPPLGILYLISSLKENGFKDVDYIDLAGNNFLEFADLITSNYDVVGFSMTTPQIEIGIEIATWFMNNSINTILIAGGCGVSSLPEEHPFDYIIKGEGEYILPELIGCIENGNKFDKSIINNIPDVNTIPYPDRKYLEGYSYKIDGIEAVTMLTSRGCPFSCSFCADAKNKVRIRTVENVKGEIDEIYNQGYRAIMFFDDIFTAKISRVKEIGEYLKSKEMIYRCFTHVRYAAKVAKILAETGCKEVGIGIESGDNNILKNINKNFTSEQSLEAVRVLEDHGLRVKVFMMLGLPGETNESIRNTEKWLWKAHPFDFDLCIYTPYPDTDIWDNRDNYDISWNGGDMNLSYKGKDSVAVCDTSALTKEEILNKRNKIERLYRS